MISLTRLFSQKYLTDVVWPTKYQAEKEQWNVSGILKNRLNEHLKFDTRPMQKNETLENLITVKYIKVESKADKILLFYNNNFLIIDSKEFYSFMKNKNIEKTDVDFLKENLDWNIMLPI